MSAKNGTFTALAASWSNLLTLLQGQGYPGRSALTNVALAPAGTIRVARGFTAAPGAPTAGIGIGTGAIGGATFEWNMAQRGSFLEASQTWIYGDGTDVEFDVTGAEW